MPNDIMDPADARSVIPYDRERAVAYAHRWAYFRNPAFFDFQDIGGDCTNFASQCLYAGSGVMNFTPVYGWYYINAEERTPSWTGVEYFYKFLTQNTGPGPFGVETDIYEVQPGDFVQLAFEDSTFAHTPVIVFIQGQPIPDNVYVAAHSMDSDCRPLSSYHYTDVRFIHIRGVRSAAETPQPPPGAVQPAAPQQMRFAQDENEPPLRRGMP